MNAMIVIIAGLVLVVLLKKTTVGGSSSSSITSSGVPSVLLPIETAPAPTFSEKGQQQAAGMAVQAANFIPVVGPAVAGTLKQIFGSLFSASAARAKEAISENTAVAKAVNMFDQGVKEIIDGANNGTISASDAAGYSRQLLQLYWNYVTPYIQPGRNGCSSGGNCQAVHDAFIAGKNLCTGSIGAACCVGCTSIQIGVERLMQLFASPNGGTVNMPNVFGSTKYGGASRAAYSVTYKPPSVVSSLLNFL